MLTTKTNSRPPIKRKILPSASSIFLPALWSEGVRVRTIEVCSAVHCVDAICDDAAFSYVDGGSSAWPAADGEGGVFVCDAEVEWDGGLEAEGCGC